jgi:hypothetical protein
LGLPSASSQESSLDFDDFQTVVDRLLSSAVAVPYVPLREPDPVLNTATLTRGAFRVVRKDPDELAAMLDRLVTLFSEIEEDGRDLQRTLVRYYEPLAEHGGLVAAKLLAVEDWKRLTQKGSRPSLPLAELLRSDSSLGWMVGD